MDRAVRALLFGAIGAIGIVLMFLPAAGERVVWFSPLWYYGLILLVLSALGILIDRSGNSRWAVVLAYFLVFDLFLAGSTRILHRLGFSADLLPVMEYRMLGPKGFKFHPLLQMAPTPDYRDSRNLHTELGTRSVRPRPADGKAPADATIALVGGSSTYDISVPQGQTWADRLQEKLPAARIWNLGVPGYTSVEHIIQTAYYIPELNPTCVVYYLGWNDVRNNNLPDLDAGFANYHLLDRGNHERVANSASPLATLRLMKLLVAAVEVYPSRPSYWTTAKVQQSFDPRLEGLFGRNIETLIAINRQRGTRVAFIGQLLNYPALTRQPPGAREFAAPAVEDRFIPQVMDQLNAVTAKVTARYGVPFIQPRQDWMEAGDYSDFGHFTRTGAEKFATRVAGFIEGACSTRN